MVVVFGVVFAFLMADFFWSQGNFDSTLVPGVGTIPDFDHGLHGDSIGLDCAACHTGARSAAKAYMPSKRDCMDCHRLPLTENPGIENLDSTLARAPEHPWVSKSVLPEHVVFHHGVHSAAGVNCTDCHGMKTASGGSTISRNAEAKLAVQYTASKATMQSCVRCHKGETFNDRNFKRAATYCAACHR